MAWKPSVQQFNRYLRQSRADILSYSSSKVYHVVTGNEASDADSIISALVYAFFKSQHEKINVVPVMSIVRSDFGLRCETNALMKRLEVDIDAVVFADEIDLNRLHQTKQLRLILTDHNELCQQRQHLNEAVDEIVDHHQDMGKHIHVSGERRLIAFDPTGANGGKALVGSCCTLVAEKLLNQQIVTPIEATLLLAAISLDTVNFEPSAGKATSRDISAAAKLTDQSAWSNPDFFEWLQSEKFNVEYWKDFTMAECLRYDYKQFDGFGISSVLIPIPELLAKVSSKDQVAEALQNYCHTKKIQCLFIMSNCIGGDRVSTRQLMIYSSDDQVLQRMQSLCESISCLELNPLETDFETKHLIIYHQGNNKISRKKFVPLLIVANQ